MWSCPRLSLFVGTVLLKCLSFLPSVLVCILCFVCIPYCWSDPVHDRPRESPYLPRVCGFGGGFILSQYDIETVKALRDRECYRLALDMCIDLYSDLSVTHEVAFKFLSDNGLLTHCYRDFELVQLQDNAEKWQSILNSFDFGGCKNGSND